MTAVLSDPAERATRADFAGWHVLGFDLEDLQALAQLCGRGGIKSVTIPCRCGAFVATGR